MTHSNYYNKETDSMMTCEICRATVPIDDFCGGLCDKCWIERDHAIQDFRNYILNVMPNIDKVVVQMRNGQLTVDEFRTKMAELLDL